MTYVAIRVVAGTTFVLAATLMPRGIGAAVVIVLAGITAVMTCVGVNAGGPGERAGARPQDRWFDAHSAPQGDWPPYDSAPSSEGETRLVPEATPPQGNAS